MMALPDYHEKSLPIRRNKRLPQKGVDHRLISGSRAFSAFADSFNHCLVQHDCYLFLARVAGDSTTFASAEIVFVFHGSNLEIWKASVFL